jgi:membrane-bound ClpP family serine protease
MNKRMWSRQVILKYSLLQLPGLVMLIPNSLIGSTGVAVDQLSPSGYVRINGELWRARVIENDSTIEKGETVVVKGVDGLTLTVIPFTSSSPLF